MRELFMYSKFLYAIFLAIVLSAFAFAAGNFHGVVPYTGEGCDNTMGDQVAIQSTSGGPIKYYYIDHLHTPHEYTTSPDTFPPGNYKLWVVCQDKDCYGSDVEIVSHSSNDQEVNLTVHGAEGGGQ
jgi:hypothetical protein